MYGLSRSDTMGGGDGLSEIFDRHVSFCTDYIVMRWHAKGGPGSKKHRSRHEHAASS
jgi:hypothetical protein